MAGPNQLSLKRHQEEPSWKMNPFLIPKNSSSNYGRPKSIDPETSSRRTQLENEPTSNPKKSRLKFQLIIAATLKVAFAVSDALVMGLQPEQILGQCTRAKPYPRPTIGLAIPLCVNSLINFPIFNRLQLNQSGISSPMTRPPPNPVASPSQPPTLSSPLPTLPLAVPPPPMFSSPTFPLTMGVFGIEGFDLGPGGVLSVFNT
ncbi:Hypothetical predicted protein [Olea europaea subsp. europaea]|uniref:Uncharacterized protein n=1 Tax=Olea europaea subsp. europaea TaxID=158383 RepID=A0A8S0SHI6_OLEEU|nr:Hypothetical predicted protein [Olea europaea subsp. europaea]